MSTSMKNRYIEVCREFHIQFAVRLGEKIPRVVSTDRSERLPDNQAKITLMGIVWTVDSESNHGFIMG